MPEAPELEAIAQFLLDRVVGARIASATVIKPSVLRSMCGQLDADAPGRRITDVQRRGKFLLLTLSGSRLLAMNPMLTGALQFCAPSDRLFKRTCIVLSLSEGWELRYLDERQMGSVYYLRQDQFGQLPRIGQQGPMCSTMYRLRSSNGASAHLLERSRVS